MKTALPTDTLFDPDAGLPPQEAMRRALIDAYREQLLSRPPVRCLQHDQPDRAREAQRLAVKDVDRLLLACRERGLTLILACPPTDTGLCPPTDKQTEEAA